jgi:histone H3/H4
MHLTLPATTFDRMYRLASAERVSMPELARLAITRLLRDADGDPRR